MEDQICSVRSPAARSSIPDCVRDIINSPPKAPPIPPELDEVFSHFSFPSFNQDVGAICAKISRPCSPLTYEVPDISLCGEEFELLPLDPNPSPEPTVATGTTSSSASSKKPSKSSGMSWVRLRRSSQEVTYLELDILTEDVRRVRDGMQESLRRYLCQNSWCGYFSQQLMLTCEVPPWHGLKHSLSSLTAILRQLLEIVREEMTEKECDEVTAKLAPALTTATHEGFAILKSWNARDEKLLKYIPRGFIPLTKKQRKRLICDSCDRLADLRRSMRRIEDSVTWILLDRARRQRAEERTLGI